jgi:CHASE2 domain-containing sensor protein
MATSLFELGYVFFSLLLVVYCAWHYLKQKKKHFIYFTIGFIFMTLSLSFQLFSSTWWVYIMQFGIGYRFLELVTLAFFACFVISTIMALRETSRAPETR